MPHSQIELLGVMLNVQPEPSQDNPYLIGERRWWAYEYIKGVQSHYQSAIDRFRELPDTPEYHMFRRSLEYYRHAVGVTKHMLSNLAATQESRPFSHAQQKRQRK